MTNLKPLIIRNMVESKAETIKCEKSHIAIDGIAPKYTGANKYPYYINVKFANGRIKTYRQII